MKKGMIVKISSILLMLSMLICMGVKTEAADEARRVDGSLLVHEEESVGNAVPKTRGEYYQTGYSKIVRLGPGVIYAGGTTIAEKTVESVKVGVMVERCAEDEDIWYFVDGWTKENKNADLVSANRRLTVEGGYYYRVRCYHSANSDVSSSATDGIFIEKP